MAVRATASRGADAFIPQRLALLHPQEARIARVIVLHGARLRAGILIAGVFLPRRHHQQRGQRDPADHSTVMLAVSVCTTP